MNPKIRLMVVAAFTLLAPLALFYAWLFEHMLEPSLPIIPLAAAMLALMCGGAAGYNVAELFGDMERDSRS